MAVKIPSGIQFAEIVNPDDSLREMFPAAKFGVFHSLMRVRKLGIMGEPIILSDEAISEFQQIYESEFGDTLSAGQAQEMALRLLRLFDLLSQALRETEP